MNRAMRFGAVIDGASCARVQCDKCGHADVTLAALDEQLASTYVQTEHTCDSLLDRDCQQTLHHTITRACTRAAVRPVAREHCFAHRTHAQHAPPACPRHAACARLIAARRAAPQAGLPAATCPVRTLRAAAVPECVWRQHHCPTHTRRTCT